MRPKKSPKKSLGQNFLTSVGALNDIISASGACKTDTILEIGPGKGVLTQKLLETGARVIAIEKDEELGEYLKDIFKKEIERGRLELVVGDITEIPLTPFLKKGVAYKLIANIPYYITGQIFRMFLESDNQPSSITVIVQKEVAERIVAKNKKESLLSMSVKAYGTPYYVSTVKRGSFFPIPNVDSAVLHIGDISKKLFTQNDMDESYFFEILKAGFAHKRKLLSGNLKERGFVFPPSLDPKARAEDIVLVDWITISKYQNH